MAFFDVIQNGVSSVLGTISTAYIKVWDRRDELEGEVSLGSLEKTGGSGSAKALGKFAEKAKSKALEVADAAGGGLLSSIAGAMGMNNLRKDDYNKAFKVQFNPSTLQIRSYGGGDDVQMTDYSATKSRGNITMAPPSLHVELSVKLIFDKLVESEAYGADAMIINSNRVIEGIKNTGSDLIFGGSNISVQNTVEAFIATVRNPYTHGVCFEWGDLYYEGQVKTVNSTYTMFDGVGKPIRAEVTLTIYLQDRTITDSDLGHWDDAWEEVFGGGNLSLGTLSSKSGALGSFLNI